jgi:hypothetical protein
MDIYLYSPYTDYFIFSHLNRKSTRKSIPSKPGLIYQASTTSQISVLILVTAQFVPLLLVKVSSLFVSYFGNSNSNQRRTRSISTSSS